MSTRGAATLIGMSTGVASGNYVAAGVSLLHVTNTNPATLEGISLFTSMAVAGVAGGVAASTAGTGVVSGVAAGVGTAGAYGVAAMVMAIEIGGVVGGVEMASAYGKQTQAINTAISNIQSETATEDQSFQNYINQAQNNGALIANAAIQGAFPSGLLAINPFDLVLLAAGAFTTAVLIF